MPTQELILQSIQFSTSKCSYCDVLRPYLSALGMSRPLFLFVLKRFHEDVSPDYPLN